MQAGSRGSNEQRERLPPENIPQIPGTLKGCQSGNWSFHSLLKLLSWRGAKITGFTATGGTRFSVKVQVGAETHFVNYALNPDGSVKFDFLDSKGQVKTETYSPRTRGGGGDRPPGGGDPKGKGGKKKGEGKAKGGER